METMFCHLFLNGILWGVGVDFCTCFVLGILISVFIVIIAFKVVGLITSFHSYCRIYKQHLHLDIKKIQYL